MALVEHQKRHLRKVGHHLKPVVMVGQSGLTDSVLAEADSALDHHELIKMRLNAVDRLERRTMIERIAEQLGCELVHAIGHTALFFRRHPSKPKIILPGPRKSSR